MCLPADEAHEQRNELDIVRHRLSNTSAWAAITSTVRRKGDPVPARQPASRGMPDIAPCCSPGCSEYRSFRVLSGDEPAVVAWPRHQVAQTQHVHHGLSLSPLPFRFRFAKTRSRSYSCSAHASETRSMVREELWPELLGSVITSTGAAPCSMPELETANTKITPCTKYSVHEVLFMAETEGSVSELSFLVACCCALGRDWTWPCGDDGFLRPAERHRWGCKAEFR